MADAPTHNAPGAAATASAPIANMSFQEEGPLEDDDDNDPVTAEYDVYITPQLSSSASLYLLQFPTREREQPYNADTANAPLELRMKPNSGFLEMDVPMNQDFNFDKGKAQTWGSALAKTKAEGAVTYGLAGGFSHHTGLRGPPAQRGGAGRGRGGLQDFEDREGAVFAEQMMKAQTLGGQIVKEERGRPNYMIGAFRGAELHLTPVNGIIQMRPQFHHIDAKTVLERNMARRSREATGESASSARPAEPRVVQMISKSNTEAENLEGQSESTREHLTKAMEEGWTRLEWVDEETEKAYEAWHGSMFLQETSKAPRLVASMEDEAYLDEISAPRLDPSGKRVLRPMHRKAKTAAAGHGMDQDDDGEEDEDEATAEDAAEEQHRGSGEDGGADDMLVG